MFWSTFSRLTLLIDLLTHWLLVFVLIFEKLIVFSQEGRHEGGVPPMPQADIQVLYRRHLFKISFQDLQTGVTRFTKGSPWKSP